jgi:hypothetical protein
VAKVIELVGGRNPDIQVVSAISHSGEVRGPATSGCIGAVGRPSRWEVSPSR